IAQKEDVATVTLNRKILIDGSNNRAVLVVSNDAVIGDLRDSPTTGERSQPGVLTAAQPAVHAVVVQIGRVPALPRRDPLAEHFQHRAVIRARQLSVRVSASTKLEEGILVPVVAGDSGYDLLSQDI